MTLHLSEVASSIIKVLHYKHDCNGRQYLVDTPETKEGHEPSDNLTNALKVKDMVKHEDEDINDNYNHISSVDSARNSNLF